MRINNLDYLRGLMALGILIYHYFKWTFGEYDANSFLGVVGVYGVSVFYILSGITLYYVYKDNLTFNKLFPFYLKRIFRIYPLMWLTILMSFLIIGKIYDFKTYFLNFTGLFGFIEPDNYIVTGAWSIGNELVFYSIFPFIILFDQLNKRYGLFVVFLLSLIIEYYFTFYILTKNVNLSEQWNIYINPFNQFFLFVGGMIISKIMTNYKNNFMSLILFIISMGIYLFYPVGLDKINLVVETNRFIFSAASFLLASAFLINNSHLKPFFTTILQVLGHISYSLYLTHALIFWFVAKFINRVNYPILFLIISIILTIIISLIIYYTLEKRFIKLGKKVIKKYYT